MSQSVEEQKIIRRWSSAEFDRRGRLGEMMRNAPIPHTEQSFNLGLFMPRQLMSRILFFNEIYQQILPVHGSLMEFGTRWGQSLAIWSHLRSVYEPFNYTRRIVGFDTFEGFVSVNPLDGNAENVVPGAYAVTKNYEDFLSDLMQLHEQDAPIPHKRKFDLVKGDVTQTLPAYLEAHKETVVAFAYFDMDLYEPTLAALKALRPYLTKGSIIGFDEVCLPDFPGETVALREALGTNNFALRRVPHNPVPSYLVIE